MSDMTRKQHGGFRLDEGAGAGSGQTMPNVQGTPNPGNDLLRASNNLMRLGEQWKAREDETDVREYFTTFDDQERAVAATWGTRKQEEARGLGEEAAAWFDERKAEIEQRFDGRPTARADALAKLEARRAHRLDRVALYEDSERETYDLTVLDNVGRERLNTIAYNYHDPAKVTETLAEMGDDLSEHFPEAEAARRMADFQDKALTRALFAEANDNPRQARKRLEEYGPLMSANTRERVIAKVESSVAVLEREEAYRRREAEIMQAKAAQERAVHYEATLADHMAFAASSGEVPDNFYEVTNAYRALGGKHADRADELERKVDRYRELNLWVEAGRKDADGNHTSIAQQQARLEELRPVAADGASEQMEMYNAAAGILAGEAKAIQQDPAAYAHQLAVEEVVSTYTDSWMSDDQRVQIATRRSLEIQKELGITHPKPWTVRQAATIKDQYERATPQGRAEIIKHVQAQGDLAPAIMNQLELGAEHEFAVGMFQSDPVYGSKVLRAIDLKPGDIGIEDAERTDIKRSVSEAFHSHDIAEVLEGQYQLTGDAGVKGMMDRMEELTLKMGYLDRDADKAVKEMWGKFRYVNDDELGFAWLPSWTDPDAVEVGMRVYRAGLTADAIDFGDRADFLEDMRTGAIWKNSADGQGFVLCDPVSGKTLTRDGKPLVVSLDELTHGGGQDKEPTRNEPPKPGKPVPVRQYDATEVARYEP